MRSILLTFLFAVVSQNSGAIEPFDLMWMNHKTTGTLYKSNQHPKGIFVLETYFKNCPYCVKNSKNVNDLSDKYANEPRVQVLDIGIDKADGDYQSWINSTKPNHPVLKDAQRVVVRQLGTSGYPSTYVLDSKLNVHYKHSGVWDSNARRKIQMTIDELLKQDD